MYLPDIAYFLFSISSTRAQNVSSSLSHINNSATRWLRSWPQPTSCKNPEQRSKPSLARVVSDGFVHLPGRVWTCAEGSGELLEGAPELLLSLGAMTLSTGAYTRSQSPWREPFKARAQAVTGETRGNHTCATPRSQGGQAAVGILDPPNEAPGTLCSVCAHPMWAHFQTGGRSTRVRPARARKENGQGMGVDPGCLYTSLRGTRQGAWDRSGGWGGPDLGGLS